MRGRRRRRVLRDELTRAFVANGDVIDSGQIHLESHSRVWQNRLLHVVDSFVPVYAFGINYILIRFLSTSSKN